MISEVSIHLGGKNVRWWWRKKKKSQAIQLSPLPTLLPIGTPAYGIVPPTFWQIDSFS